MELLSFHFDLMSSFLALFLKHLISTKGLSDEQQENDCWAVNHYTQVYLSNQCSPDELNRLGTLTKHLERAFVLALKALDKRT